MKHSNLSKWGRKGIRKRNRHTTSKQLSQWGTKAHAGTTKQERSERARKAVQARWAKARALEAKVPA